MKILLSISQLLYEEHVLLKICLKSNAKNTSENQPQFYDLKLYRHIK